MGSEGGLASFAWAYSALQLAMQLPQDSTVERLLFHFFKQMNLLSSMSLLVQKKDGGARVAFKPRKEPSPWAQEWIEFIFVEDPTRKHPGAGYVPGMTPQKIPTSLAALYVAEIRLAFNAIKEEKWHELWRSTNKEVKMALSGSFGKAPLHIILKNGELVVGKLEKVIQPPNLQNQELHRRDQSSQLQFRRCSFSKDPRSDSTKCVLTDKTLDCKPCNWVCALPIWNMTVKAGDAQTRLNELAILAETVKSDTKPQSVLSRLKTPVPANLVPVLRPSYMMLGGYPVGVYVMRMESAPRMHANKDHSNHQPVAVGLQSSQEAPGKTSLISDSKAEREVCDLPTASEKANSDDSTRASDSEEVTPMPAKQKNKKASRKKSRPPSAAPPSPLPATNESTESTESPTKSPVFGPSEVDHPFAMSLALNLDVPKSCHTCTSEGLFPLRENLTTRLLSSFNSKF